MNFSANNNIEYEGCSMPPDNTLLCSQCKQALCLRKKTINMALGNTETMYCLNCLGEKEKIKAQEILAKTKKYIMSRQCFKKEWVKYKDISYCPDQTNCFPDICFSK